MAISSVRNMADQHTENWVDWFKSIQFFGVAMLIPLWRAIDKYFEYKTKKDRDAIKDVVDESVQGIKDDIQELRREIQKGREETNKQIVDLYKELRK